MPAAIICCNSNIVELNTGIITYSYVCMHIMSNVSDLPCPMLPHKELEIYDVDFQCIGGFFVGKFTLFQIIIVV